MNIEEVKNRIEVLKKEIDYHRYLYHVLDKQEISDEALDSLKYELYKLEEEYPSLVTPDSPTQRVGGKPLEEFKKIEHKNRMLSLADMFSKDDLFNWENRVLKILGSVKLDYFCELKIDGLALSLVYENGNLVYGATRGDGFFGEDVTENIKTIQAIPLKIPKITDWIEIRGEVYMTKLAFDKVNQERQQNNEPIYANPRNLASGTIRQLDPKIVASRELSFFAYDIKGKNINSHNDVHLLLQELGFKIEPNGKKCFSMQEVFDYCESFTNKRNNMPYLIDGVVICVDNQNYYEKLGIVGKAPRFAVAYKFPAEQVTTIVQDIVVQIGRTGALTPVANLKPVLVAGTTVSRATLHNIEEIERLDVRVGDTVIIEKAGDIIPAIIGVLKNLRPQNSQKWQMPLFCSSCESKIEKQINGVAYYCTNKNCFGTKREKFIHFISKSGFNIEGFGQKSIERFLDLGIITSFSDIFNLTKNDLIDIEGFANKSIDNLIKEIQLKKKIDFKKFIFSLGIRHIGKETSKLFCEFLYSYYGEFKTPIDLINVIKKIKLDDLLNINGIGEKVATSLKNYFDDIHNINELENLAKAGVEFIQKSQQNISIQQNHIFKNKRFIMTGVFTNMSREDLYNEIIKRGGIIASSLNKNVDFLVAGNNAGSKLQKANEMQIKVLNEKSFFKMLGDN